MDRNLDIFIIETLKYYGRLTSDSGSREREFHIDSAFTALRLEGFFRCDGLPIYLDRFPSCLIHKSANQFVFLLLGEAVIVDSNPAAVVAANYPDKIKYLNGEDFGFEIEEYAIALPKGDAALKDAIDVAITKIKENGTFDKLVDEYM